MKTYPKTVTGTGTPSKFLPPEASRSKAAVVPASAISLVCFFLGSGMPASCLALGEVSASRTGPWGW